MNAPLTICVLTPTGRGAVATISLAGSNAPDVISRCLQGENSRSIAEASVGRIRLGVWGSPAGEQVVVCRQAEGAYEIHCHGGAAAIEAIVNDLLAAGARRIEGHEQIAAEAPDRIAGEALIALSAARTERTAAILLDQFRGALLRELRAAQSALAQNDLIAAIALLRTLNDRSRLGRHLIEPFRVTLAGPPNVGKSSLINALVGYQRAIVHDEPGTTRDVLTAQTAVDGWPVELSDTAGRRSSDDALEQAGVERARAAARESDLVLLVRDASSPNSPADATLRAELPDALVVRNKSDLTPLSHASGVERDGEVSTSALTGAGVDRLLAAIARRLVPDAPAAGAGVPFTLEQMAAIELALNAAVAGNASLATACLAEWTG